MLQTNICSVHLYCAGLATEVLRVMYGKAERKTVAQWDQLQSKSVIQQTSQHKPHHRRPIPSGNLELAPHPTTHKPKLKAHQMWQLLITITKYCIINIYPLSMKALY
jgi:hypothetical protein